MNDKLEDVNDDGYQDIVIDIVEEVKMGINIYDKIERIEYTKIYLTTEDGFVEMNEDIIGSGTEEDPFMIYTLEGLKKIGNKDFPLDARYKLGGVLGEKYIEYKDEIFTALDLPGGLEDNFEKNFSGKIDNYGVKMNLKRAGDKLTGYYYYTEYRKKIELKGTINNASFELEEFVDGKKLVFS